MSKSNQTPMSPIKFICLWQPWASLIAFKLKEFETRSWATKYTGPLAIVATKTQPVCVNSQLERIANVCGKTSEFTELLNSLPLPQGGIVAVCHGVSCLPMSNEPPQANGQIRAKVNGRLHWLIPAMPPLEYACGNWNQGRYAWRLIGAKPTPFIPLKGRQGLGTISDPDTLAELATILYPNDPKYSQHP